MVLLMVKYAYGLGATAYVLGVTAYGLRVIAYGLGVKSIPRLLSV